MVDYPRVSCSASAPCLDLSCQAKYPAKYIYSPWEAPLGVQQQSGCVVGRDYPAPMVDHAAASKELMQRMKAAYDQHKQKGADEGAGEGEGEGEGTEPEGRTTTTTASAAAVASSARNAGYSSSSKKNIKRGNSAADTTMPPSKSRKMTDYLTDKK